MEIFSEQRLRLRRRGEPIPDHDLWIASAALQHDLALVSNDHHFDRIPELKRV
jgi:tRNA(fMet)-specific endonuclease VapC